MPNPNKRQTHIYVAGGRRPRAVVKVKEKKNKIKEIKQTKKAKATSKKTKIKKTLRTLWVRRKKKLN